VADDETVKDVARTLRAIAADVRSAGDVPLVELSEDGVTPAAITLADELWLTALRLDPDGAFSTPEPTP
jgi:hypothetical protein